MIIGAILITVGVIAWAMLKSMARSIYEVMDEIDED